MPTRNFLKTSGHQFFGKLECFHRFTVRDGVFFVKLQNAQVCNFSE